MGRVISEESEAALRYRERADLLRKIALQTVEPLRRLALFELAAHYDALAATFDILHTSERALNRSNRALSG